jgi:SAM-dependent methyltransferase/uncharacterized protein YbaR (Trm112 family)
MEQWLTELVCPRDHLALSRDGGDLVCEGGHRYPVIEEVPVLLLNEASDTLWVARASLDARPGEADPYYTETIGCGAAEREAIRRELAAGTSSGIDPVVKYMVAATGGLLYRPLVGHLDELPIPHLPLPEGAGRLLLDVGCNWGRWCIAAARKGYRVVGIDPSLGAVLAAKRLAAQLRLDAQFVVGDARYLPFPAQSFDVVHSFSVFQHFSKPDVKASLKQVGRVLRDKGTSLIQMPNALGIRSVQVQLRQVLSKHSSFEVRYWTPWALKRTFSQLIGISELAIGGFFGLGVVSSDARFLPRRYQLLIRASDRLSQAARKIRPLLYLADSLYVRSAKTAS